MIHPVGIIGVLCTPLHEDALSIHKKPHRTRAQAIEKPEKPGCRSSEGGEVAPRLTDTQIVLPRRTGNIPQMSDFSQRGLCQDKSAGEWRIVCLAVLHSAWRGKSPTSYPYTEGEPCSTKKPRPEALLPPSKASGRLLGQAS
jgi:hypothetical protein